MSHYLKPYLEKFQIKVPEEKLPRISIVACQYSHALTILDKSISMTTTHELRDMSGSLCFVKTETARGVSISKMYALDQPVRSCKIENVDIQDCISGAMKKDLLVSTAVRAKTKKDEKAYTMNVSQWLFGETKEPGPIELKVTEHGPRIDNKPRTILELKYDPLNDIHTFGGRSFQSTGGGEKGTLYKASMVYSLAETASDDLIRVEGCVFDKDKMATVNPRSVVDNYHAHKLPSGYRDADALAFFYSTTHRGLTFLAIKRDGKIGITYQGKDYAFKNYIYAWHNGGFSEGEIKIIDDSMQLYRKGVEGKFIERVGLELWMYNYVRMADEYAKKGGRLSFKHPLMLSTMNMDDMDDMVVKLRGKKNKVLSELMLNYEPFLPGLNSTKELMFYKDGTKMPSGKGKMTR